MIRWFRNRGMKQQLELHAEHQTPAAPPKAKRGRKSNRKSAQAERTCKIETLEERRVLSATPVTVGAVYIEDDSGTDGKADTFYVSFEGGSDTTRLSQVVINTSQDGSENTISEPDVYFDTVANNQAGNVRGSGNAHGFQVESSSIGVNASQVNWQVSDGGTKIVIDIDDFKAGDKLIFSIDVDQFFKNKPDDQITSGIEFAGSQLETVFVDDHYTFDPQPGQDNGIFTYDFGFGSDDVNDTGVLSNLPTNEYRLNTNGDASIENRTAGAMDRLTLVEKPISISGTVYHDRDLDLKQDAGEEGIEGVVLRLQKLNANGNYVNATTSAGDVIRTTTDANGDYEFGVDLLLRPGTYRIIEEQPTDYPVSVGEIPGTVEGNPSGNFTPNVISNIVIPLGDQHAVDYDFAEAKLAEICGFVYHDRNNNGIKEAGEEGIAGVQLRIIPINTVGTQTPQIIETEADGSYCFKGLQPGTYRIVEVNQPTGFFDGLDTAGTVGGVVVGAATNPGDEIGGIVLKSDDKGVDYNFGELKPAEICGYVYHDRNNNGIKDAGEEGIAGVQMKLVPINTLYSQTTQFVETDENGFYCFKGLAPGQYRVVENEQPTGFLDGLDAAGTIDGQTVGAAVNPGDRINGIVLASEDQGINYNFGEIKYASLSGHVFLATPEGDCYGFGHPDYRPIAGVKIVLEDESGNTWTAFTDDQGRYEFVDLAPGTYKVVEVTSANFPYLNGDTHVGTINGVKVGDASILDTISAINLNPGENGINYDFCEYEPAAIEGNVYHDRNDNGIIDAGEEGIKSVRIVLQKNDGTFVAETFTDENGHYSFEGLYVDTYRIREIHPTGWIDGKDTAGTINGATVGDSISTNDRIKKIYIKGGERGIEYNFGELKLGSIQGMVHADIDGNCILDSVGEKPIEGVQIDLLDKSGNVIATTFTDKNGEYRFDDIAPGEYSVRQHQPAGYFEGDQMVGKYADLTTGTGDASVQNLLQQIIFQSDTHYVDYNFCEVPPSQLSGYVFQDGAAIFSEQALTPSQILKLRDGKLTSDDTRLSGVILELRNGITGLPIDASQALPGYYGSGPIRTTTDANGFYQFLGLPSGNYAVFEVHPDGYIDHVDSPGTTSGIAINATDNISPLVLQTLDAGVNPANDAILRIALGVGASSEQNNFAEVKIESEPPRLIPPPPQDPTPEFVPRGWVPPAERLYAAHLPVRDPQNPLYLMPAGEEYTWHLSVIDAGIPRGQGEFVNLTTDDASREASFAQDADWKEKNIDAGEWVISFNDPEEWDREFEGRRITFGTTDGIPVIGDFNGDGVDEVAIYHNGHWFIDLNGNGTWDQLDLWARLGNEQDRPVVGDWDGDGKEDIGIFGPIWAGDMRAIENEPGLPDPDNSPFDRKAKNVPPTEDEATTGRRVMRLTSTGKDRVDLIDHVFKYGEEEDTPIAGDWNGAGIRSIGTFRGGTWKLDMDGDGRLTEKDKQIQFGQAGDLPVVGDFNGDGIEEIGVFRDGTWILDTNGNHEHDALDTVFQHGDAGDLPLAGDFDGDGIDEPVLYRPGAPAKE